MIFEFTLNCAPTTKKNSGQIVMVGKFPRIFPSKKYREFNLAAQRELVLIRRRLESPIDVPVNCAALFYRQTNIGDLVGYLQAIADTMEEAGIVTNDRLVTQWDGSRLLKDQHRPRIEVTLTTLAEMQTDLELLK